MSKKKEEKKKERLTLSLSVFIEEPLDRTLFLKLSNLECRRKKILSMVYAGMISITELAEGWIEPIYHAALKLLEEKPAKTVCALKDVPDFSFEIQDTRTLPDDLRRIFDKLHYTTGGSTRVVLALIKALSVNTGIDVLFLGELYSQSVKIIADYKDLWAKRYASLDADFDIDINTPEMEEVIVSDTQKNSIISKAIIQTESDPTVEEVITEPEPVKPAPMVSPEDARELFITKMEAMKNKVNGTPAIEPAKPDNSYIEEKTAPAVQIKSEIKDIPKPVQEKSYIENRNIPKPEASAIPPVKKINPQNLEIQELEAELLRRKRLKHAENEFKDRYGKFTTLWEKYKKHHKFRKDPEVEEACRNAYNAFARFFNTEDHQERAAQLKTVEDAIIVLRASENN
ncbi:MAG: hypothetical protein IJT84_02035 [Clostridia bacterium]|nr:hypothetical protein [Clostridia bacterium]